MVMLSNPDGTRGPISVNIPVGHYAHKIALRRNIANGEMDASFEFEDTGERQRDEYGKASSPQKPAIVGVVEAETTQRRPTHVPAGFAAALRGTQPGPATSAADREALSQLQARRQHQRRSGGPCLRPHCHRPRTAIGLSASIWTHARRIRQRGYSTFAPESSPFPSHRRCTSQSARFLCLRARVDRPRYR